MVGEGRGGSGTVLRWYDDDPASNHSPAVLKYQK